MPRQSPCWATRLCINTTGVIKLQRNAGLAIERRKSPATWHWEYWNTADLQFYFSPECWRKWPSLAGPAQGPWTGTSRWGSGWGNFPLQVHQRRKRKRVGNLPSQYSLPSQGNVDTLHQVGLIGLHCDNIRQWWKRLSSDHMRICFVIHFFHETLTVPVESLLRPNE